MAKQTNKASESKAVATSNKPAKPANPNEPKARGFDVEKTFGVPKAVASKLEELAGNKKATCVAFHAIAGATGLTLSTSRPYMGQLVPYFFKSCSKPLEQILLNSTSYSEKYFNFAYDADYPAGEKFVNAKGQSACIGTAQALILGEFGTLLTKELVKAMPKGHDSKGKDQKAIKAQAIEMLASNVG